MFEKNSVRFSSFVRYLYFRLKAGGLYWETLTQQIAYESLSKEELFELQFERLRSLLIHAYENVPFYHEKFRKAGFDPYSFSSMEDFKRVPTTTKEELKKASTDSLKAKNLPSERFIKDKTSGSTGVPLFFFKDAQFEISESCALLREQLRAGSYIGSNVLILRGTRPFGLKKGFFRTVHFFSTKKFDEKRFYDFVSFVKRNKISLIEGFPSFMVAVGRKLEEKGMSLKVPIVLTGGEMLFDRDRKIIEKTFSAKVFDHYGAAEGMAIAMECEKHNGLHYDPTRFVLEVVDESGKPLTDKEGVVCLTNLENYAMPFIRYLMNDRTSLLSRTCSCGLNFPLIDPIQGRTLDTYWTPSGRLIDFNLLDPYEHYPHLDAFQMVLHKNNVLEARIVPKGDPQAVKRSIEEYLKDYLRGDLDFVVTVVDEIPPGPTGKRPYIIVER